MPAGRRVVSVVSSSKKAGKSTVASFLVRALKADGALKVSSGTHTPSAIVTDTEVLAKPGTDTCALLEAGAKKVLWVNAPPSRLAAEMERALGMFPPRGTLVIEGNSALAHVQADFTVFVMTVPFAEFKPSAETALERADLVLVDMRWKLSGKRPSSIREGLGRRAPRARVIFYSDEKGLAGALSEAARMARA